VASVKMFLWRRWANQLGEASVRCTSGKLFHYKCLLGQLLLE